MKIILALWFIASLSHASIINNEISPNSVIKASDINFKLSEISDTIQNNEFLNNVEFLTVQVGQEVSKNSILYELYKIIEIYPNSNELSLSDEISSSELNYLFSSTKSLVQSFNDSEVQYSTKIINGTGGSARRYYFSEELPKTGKIYLEYIFSSDAQTVNILGTDYKLNYVPALWVGNLNQTISTEHPPSLFLNFSVPLIE